MDLEARGGLSFFSGAQPPAGTVREGSQPGGRDERGAPRDVREDDGLSPPRSATANARMRPNAQTTSFASKPKKAGDVSWF